MKNKKKLLNGYHDFKSIVGNNGYFVDKTLLIKEFIDNNNLITLIPRPRRFGKTLNLSMLEYFFDINKKNYSDLFSEYKINEHKEFCEKYQNQYPVINISLKDIKELNWKDCKESLKTLMSDLYEKHKYLLKSEKLESYEKQIIKDIILETAKNKIYKYSLRNLSKYLKIHFEKEVIILADEYDTPIISAYKATYMQQTDDTFYAEIISFLQTFFGTTFKGNDNLHKGLITGIMRIARESIFSDLNNLGVYTIFDYNFADKFGFTEKETKKIINYFVPNNNFKMISRWYNGYKFGNVDKIFNPWSIVNYISKYQQGFEAYWLHSGTDDIIKNQFLKQGNKELREDLEKLIKGKAIKKTVEKDFIFPDLEINPELVWSLLLFTGYLKPIIDTDKITQNYEPVNNFYFLTSPNFEIKRVYTNIIKYYFDKTITFRYSKLMQMLEYLINNEMNKFKKMFSEFVYKLSYYDIAGDNSENVYHAFVLGLLAHLQGEYQINSNRESGKGRADIILIPNDKNKIGIIMELKITNKNASKKIIGNKTKEAFAQITKNNYAYEIIENEVKNHTEIVMVFTGKEVKINYRTRINNF